MKLDVVQNEKATIAKIEGRIDATTAQEFEAQIKQAAPESGGVLVCDLSAVSYISSAGLRAVLIIAKRLKSDGSAFSVCGSSGPVAEVFRISGFEKIIPMHATREDALAAANA